jgi:exodeoxyribonuclease-5
VGGYLKADYVLQTIHRQAAESPIIQQAYQVRSGKHYHDLGIDGFSVKRDIDAADLLGADIVLCWKNSTVNEYNQAIREFKGFSGEYAQVGEQVLCLRNYPHYGIMNGGIYVCTEAYNPGRKTIGILVNNRQVTIPLAGWRTVNFDDGFKTAFDFGWALTVHRSQGSEWDKVLLLDEFKGKERSKWLYTAITRAAKSIIVCPAY